MNMTSLIRNISSLIKGTSTGNVRINTRQETASLSMDNELKLRREAELDNKVIFISSPTSIVVLIYDEKS
ncbi:MAG: hypothetical protein RXR11_03545, partial [Caldivirga sp.]